MEERLLERLAALRTDVSDLFREAVVTWWNDRTVANHETDLVSPAARELLGW